MFMVGFQSVVSSPYFGLKICMPVFQFSFLSVYPFRKEGLDEHFALKVGKLVQGW